MSKKISPKVGAAAAAAAVTTIGCWIAEVNGLSIPAEVQGAITTVLVFAAGWAINDPSRSGEHSAP